MATYYQSDTIAAIATPPGTGGIAILRASGIDALDYLKRLFVPGKPSKYAHPVTALTSQFSFRPRYLHYGFILDKAGDILDEVLAVYMPGPSSVTGEDIVEVHCHGGQAIATAVLEAFLYTGARLALPGEFTKRAYLNGCLDLTQAEAVLEAINAPTREGARLAEAKLSGALAKKISELRAALDSLRIQMTVAVDFPDDEPEILPFNTVLDIISHAKEGITSLVSAYERAMFWREGAVVVLAGQVNVGKSSLLNTLLGRQRSIVSSLAGTTRDYIEESINIHGMAIRLVDTAGLRQGGDIVEEEGIRHSYQQAEEADLLLLVIDSTKLIENKGKLDPVEVEFLARHNPQMQNKRVLLVLNKSDISQSVPCLEYPFVAVSALEGNGLEALIHEIFSLLTSSTQRVEGDIAPNRRQCTLLSQALDEICLLETDIKAGLTADILAIRVDHAVRLLDDVTGTTPDETILDEIFSSFCIGK